MDYSVINYARRQFASILQMVNLNFGPLSEYPQDMHGIGRYEPRIEYIAKQLKLILPFFEQINLFPIGPPSSFFLKNISLVCIVLLVIQ